MERAIHSHEQEEEDSDSFEQNIFSLKTLRGDWVDTMERAIHLQRQQPDPDSFVQESFVLKSQHGW